jgi:hypothetical protein
MRRDEHVAAIAARNERMAASGKTAPSVSIEDYEAPLGKWPLLKPRPQDYVRDSLRGLRIALALRGGKPWAKVYIVLLPTDDPTTIPAHVHWGGWNNCPPPEYHVAALREWRDRYGAESAFESRRGHGACAGIICVL